MVITGERLRRTVDDIRFWNIDHPEMKTWRDRIPGLRRTATQQHIREIFRGERLPKVRKEQLDRFYARHPRGQASYRSRVRDSV